MGLYQFHDHVDEKWKGIVSINGIRSTIHFSLFIKDTSSFTLPVFNVTTALS